MIRLVLKLAVVALLANAVVRIGGEYLTHVRFRDEIRNAATFRAKSDEELRQRIFELAADHDVEISDEDVVITRENRTVSIEGSYVKPIEIVPRYQVPWRFSLTMDVDTQTMLPGQ